MWPIGWQQASAATHVALPGWEKYSLYQIHHTNLKGTKHCWTQAKLWFSTCQIYTGRGTSIQPSGLESDSYIILVFTRSLNENFQLAWQVERNNHSHIYIIIWIFPTPMISSFVKGTIITFESANNVHSDSRVRNNNFKGILLFLGSWWPMNLRTVLEKGLPTGGGILPWTRLGYTKDIYDWEY